MKTSATSGIHRRTLLKGISAIAGAGLLPGPIGRAAWAAEAPVAETRHGKVRGAAVDGVLVFKGVRYADDTGGANRFMPPRPPKPWPGIRDALDWGASAPQVAESRDPFYAWYTTIQPVSEDCLFLNVYTPALHDGKRRPVMVWLHGGSWGACAGTAPGFDGTRLARQEDVVVVTVNHRLNAFGYLQLDDADERFRDAGNAGMLDLAAALEWVRDHADGFGGDPRNVTIFGQSGGAAKTLALMGMPRARGLFHKAIVQSCSGGMRITGREEASMQARDLAGQLGGLRMTGDNLQKIAVADIVAATRRIADPFRPVIDGRTFARDPFYPDAPSISSDVPLMVGNANTETTYYLQVDPANFSLAMPDVQRRLKRFLKIEDAGVDRLIDGYRSSYPRQSPSELLTTITTDYVFKRNTLRVASLRAARAGSSAYAYVFARETPIQGGRIHSPHTGEVPFIFGTTEAAVDQVGRTDDLVPMTRRMMATWAAFARKGDPDNASIPTWKPYTDPDHDTMILSMQSRLEKDPGGTARALLGELPYYEYSMPRSAFVRD